MLFLSLFLACAADMEVGDSSIPEESVEQCATLYGRHVCDFEAIDENGQSVYLSELRGQPVVLDLSAMWCGPCISAGRETQSKADQLSDVHFLTVLIEDESGNVPDQSDIERWQQTTGIESEPIWGSSRAILTSDPFELGGKFYLEGWPTFYFIDSEGKLVDYMKGYEYNALLEKAAVLD